MLKIHAFRAQLRWNVIRFTLTTQHNINYAHLLSEEWREERKREEWKVGGIGILTVHCVKVED